MKAAVSDERRRNDAKVINASTSTNKTAAADGIKSWRCGKPFQRTFSTISGIRRRTEATPVVKATSPKNESQTRSRNSEMIAMVRMYGNYVTQQYT